MVNETCVIFVYERAVWECRMWKMYQCNKSFQLYGMVYLLLSDTDIYTKERKKNVFSKSEKPEDIFLVGKKVMTKTSTTTQNY